MDPSGLFSTRCPASCPIPGPSVPATRCRAPLPLEGRRAYRGPMRPPLAFHPPSSPDVVPPTRVYQDREVTVERDRVITHEGVYLTRAIDGVAIKPLLYNWEMRWLVVNVAFAVGALVAILLGPNWALGFGVVSVVVGLWLGYPRMVAVRVYVHGHDVEVQAFHDKAQARAIRDAIVSVL